MGYRVKIPTSEKYLNLGYWKSDNIALLLEFFYYHSAGVSIFKKGLIELLNIIYKYPNDRTKSLREWVKLAEKNFQKMEKE